MNSYGSRRVFLQQASASLGAALTLHGPAAWRQVLGADKKFQPRFAICNETFKDWPFEKVFALAAECGYKGIEVAPFTISDDVRDISSKRREEIRGQANKAGVEIIGLHWLLARTKGIHLTSPDRDVRRKTANYLQALAQFCMDLGGHLLVFGSPKQRNLQAGVSHNDGLQFASEVIGQAIPTFDKLDVTMALEPLSPKATNFLCTASEAVTLIELVDSPRCRLILDCNAMASESAAPADLIRQYSSHLIHFHANDPNRQGPGFGELDFLPIFTALRDVNFKGWISVEVFDYTPGPERLARESIQYMHECLVKIQ